MSQAKPEDSRNETMNARYAANRLRVVRQVRYSPDNENAIDLVFSIYEMLRTDVAGDLLSEVRRDRSGATGSDA